ncbi:MAG: hypothetical protein HYV59_09850 [Planctomycetes bacterium]|nr:hypothetical protein [Planctomycetota bacterium]
MKHLQQNILWSVFFSTAVFLILEGVYTSPVTALPLSEGHLKVLRSDEQVIELELNVDDFQVETIKHGGQTYQRLVIPDMAQSNRPGMPQIPIYGTLVGIPCIEGVSVEILDAGYEMLKGYRLLPSPEPKVMGDVLTEGAEETFVIDRKVYTTDAFYPGKAVEIGYTGYVRDQAVAQVQFYPVQYNPVTGEICLYHRILARITWDTPPSSSHDRTQNVHPAYENVLKNTLINYHSLKRPSPAHVETHHSNQSAKSSDSGNAVTNLKISVTENGIYKITYDDLTSAGLDLSGIDPSTISMSNRGTDTPIHVYGEADGKFDTSDYVLFYGSATAGIYTNENVYWLTTGGKNGQRMNTRDGILHGSSTTPTYFPATLHAEEDSHYWQAIPNGKGKDHWFWGDKLSAPASGEYTFVVDNILSTDGTATVRVRLMGYTNDKSVSPNHHTKIYLNGTEIDNRQWDGQIIYDHEVSISHSYLNNGTNTVKIETVGDTGASTDQVFVNWIEVDYFDTYTAEDDSLSFGVPESGDFHFRVTGFSSSDVEVFDVTDQGNPVRITNTTVVKEDGAYTLKFEDTAHSDTRYLALTLEQRKSAASIKADQASSWKSSDNGADYIIITHEDFYDESLALANHRNERGLRVVTVKVEDIYDEFNYGIFDPQAIRDFLSYAYSNWVAPAPVYVLLVGDACQDYKDNLDTGTVNYVPSQIVETDLLGETPSDNWFVLVSGDDILPDMYIGRLSAQTESQVEDMVNKIIYYEQHPPENSWSKNALFVADDDDSSFEDISEELAGILPEGYKANKVYVGDYTSDENPTTNIQKYINKGCLLVNYTGHGAVERWGLWNDNSEAIFNNSSVSALENTQRYPVVTVANCLNGFFPGYKTKVSMAEQFQRLQNRGAVAVWAPTGLSYSSGHRLLMKAFYEAIFNDGKYGLGAATTAAKINTYEQNSYWGELVEMFVLFGDPAMELGVSSGSTSQLTLISPNGGETINSGSTVSVQWEAPEDMVAFALKYSLNKGRSWKKITGKATGASYDWNAPSVKGNKKKCLVQITGFNASGEKTQEDVSDAMFTIKGR